MNIEEAIDILDDNFTTINTHGHYTDEEVEQARQMAIKALEQEPCEDCVSRQIISDYVTNHIQEINTGYGDLNKHTNRILRMIVDYIENLPSVTPQPKTGHWTRVTDKTGHLVWECDCGWQQRFHTNFCPDCGKKMESET